MTLLQTLWQKLWPARTSQIERSPQIDCSSSDHSAGDSNESLPDHCVLLLTNQRSGSTWLFDALRCHPAIDLAASGALWRSLGLGGKKRRYPVDLSCKDGTGRQVEVKTDCWESIPEFDTEQFRDWVPASVLSCPYAIEKFHPHFFNHAVDQFLENLKTLQQHHTIKLIYQVRDPQASLQSFLSYQHRNPTWSPDRTDEELVEHMRQVYDSILSTAQQQPGLMLDYRDLESDFGNVLQTVFAYLWPEAEFLDDQQLLIEAIAAQIRRDVRQPGNPLFLGQLQREDRFQSFCTDQADGIQRCYDAYDAIQQLRQPC